jgi:primary-amine oxidase
MTDVSDVKASDCPNGHLVAATVKDRPLLCAAVVSDGAAYEWDDYDFGLETHRAESKCLEVYTVTPADWYTYMDAWDFCGDGRVAAKVGASGTLAPAPSGYGNAHDGQPIGAGASRYALNHYHNVFWRVQFGLDDGGPAEISTVSTSTGAHRETTMTPIRSETAMQSAPDRSWMVTDPGRVNTDKHHVGYDIELHNDSPYRGVAGHAYTDNDFYVTQNKTCEILAAANSTKNGCTASVDQYVGKDKLTRPVTWMQTSFHHLPRDEDEPVVDEHWQGFMMMPHDVTATNPLGAGLPTNQ